MAGSKISIILNSGRTIISRSFLPALQNSQSETSIKFRTFSSEVAERDPGPYFFDKRIQYLLTSMTGRDYQKIFRRRKDSSKLVAPQYKFMTEEQLKKAMRVADKEAMKRIQMPPVVKKRDEITKVLSRDPALQENNKSKIVFTDITFGVENHDRLIVVREQDGTLRSANWDERHRMNQIYFPVEGREMFMPKMFEKENMEDLFKRKEYIFILDRACIQMDPDDEKYQEIVQATYESVNKNEDWEILTSTRHFGPMVFHLAWNKNIANFFLHNLKTEEIKKNVKLIEIYLKLHPDSKYDSLKYEKDDIKYMEDFANIEFLRTNIIPALQAYKELVKEREILEANIKKAHGYE